MSSSSRTLSVERTGFRVGLPLHPEGIAGGHGANQKTRWRPVQGSLSSIGQSSGFVPPQFCGAQSAKG